MSSAVCARYCCRARDDGLRFHRDGIGSRETFPYFPRRDAKWLRCGAIYMRARARMLRDLCRTLVKVDSRRF